MTTILSLILVFMLSIGGSPAASINPAGGPGDTGIQAQVDNNPNINRFFEDYTQKTASRADSKKIPEIPFIHQPKTKIRLIFILPLKEKLSLMGYEDSMNLYQAFNMNPINFTDPFGLTQVEPSIWPCYLAAKQYNPAIADIYERVSTAAMMAIGGGVTAKIMGIKFALSALLTLNITSTFDETVERRNAGQTPEQVNRAAAARLLMFGPFYKTFTGKDFGTQEGVSLEDRVATAGEIIVGTFGFMFGYEAGPKTSSGFLDLESVIGKPLKSLNIINAKTWQEYEKSIRQLYGEKTFGDRQYQAIVNGKLVDGVADNVTVINGKNVAIEAKFVKGSWADSIMNPRGKIGTFPFSKAERLRIINQAKNYLAAFDKVIYHSNSLELIKHYSRVFKWFGLDKIEFLFKK
jgi:hypothetical protein